MKLLTAQRDPLGYLGGSVVISLEWTVDLILCCIVVRMGVYVALRRKDSPVTNQIPNLCAQKIGDRWQLLRARPLWYLEDNYAIDIVDADGKSLQRFDVLTQLFPNGKQFIGDSTAGLHWSEKLVAYLANLDGQLHFIGHAWWGARFVIALERLLLRPSNAFQVQLQLIERAIVREILIETLSRAPYDISNIPEDVLEGVKSDLEGAVDLAGRLKVEEAVHLLQRLEELQLDNAYVGDSREWAFRRLSIRGTIQQALRRLGHSPRFPVIAFEQKPTIEVSPSEYSVRRSQVVDVKPGMTLRDVYNRFGPPDYVEQGQWSQLLANRGFWPFAWRYDLHTPLSSTIRLWLDQDSKTVTRVKKYYPGFWEGVYLFSNDANIVRADGSISGMLKDYQFRGKCVSIE